MCGGGGGGISPQQQQEMSDQQIRAQQEMAVQSLQVQQAIAARQETQNQDQFNYQRDQDTRRQQEADAAPGRQTTWDAARTQKTDEATQQVNDAFSKFTPDYFKQYQQDYYGQADAEINRQYGLAQKDLTFGLARTGNLASTTGADQFGQQLETKGRAEADQANAAATAATQLQTQTANAKTGLLGQALSTEVLGSPIAAGTSDGVNAAIDSSSRAIQQIGSSSRDYAAGIQPVAVSTGALAGLFGGAAGGVGNAISGANDAKLAAAVGGSAPRATALGGSSVSRY